MQTLHVVWQKRTYVDGLSIDMCVLIVCFYNLLLLFFILIV